MGGREGTPLEPGDEIRERDPPKEQNLNFLTIIPDQGDVP